MPSNKLNKTQIDHILRRVKDEYYTRLRKNPWKKKYPMPARPAAADKYAGKFNNEMAKQGDYYGRGDGGVYSYAAVFQKVGLPPKAVMAWAVKCADARENRYQMEARLRTEFDKMFAELEDDLILNGNADSLADALAKLDAMFK